MPSQVLLLERKREISHSQKRRKQCDHRGRDWSDVATHQQCRQPVEVEEARKPSPSEPLERAWPVGTLILDFWLPDFLLL